MGLRATGDSRLAYEVARAISRQARATGFNWIHSPDLDINVNPDNPGICTRSYSDRLEDVIEYAEQTCLGFKEGGLIATGKHFPGRGESSVDPHYAELTIDVDRETFVPARAGALSLPDRAGTAPGHHGCALHLPAD